MKQWSIKITSCLILVLLVTTGCTSREEFFSSGSWELDRYYYLGVDSTAGYTQTHENYLLDLKVSHNFTETQTLNGGPYSVVGNWDVTDDIKTLRLSDELNGTRVYELKEAGTTSLKIKKDVEEWWLTRP